MALRDSRRAPDRPETLEELFDRHNIRLNEFPIAGRQHGGPRSKIWCPECEGGREREKNFFVLIDRDGFGATWHCFRANNCGYSGGGRLKGAPERPQQAPRYYRRPMPEPRPERPDSLIAYYAKFHIDADTLSELGIYRTVRHMPVLDKDGRQLKDITKPRPVIAFPYVDDGVLVNVKYKSIYPDGKKRFQQEKGTRRSLFNIDNFTQFGPDDFGLIVEGEDDVAALWQCGWRQVTTLPDGSPTKVSTDFDRFTDDDQRYTALYGDRRVDDIKVWLLAGDMDEAGVRHHEEIARRLGKARCKLVRWPEDCKDAKDTLVKRGVEAVNHAIESAMFYPLEGVHVPADKEVLDYHAGILTGRITTGHGTIDERMSLSDAGQLLVGTGISGRGKTTFVNGMSVLYTEHNEKLMKEDRLLRPFHTVICSAEMRVTLMVARLIASRANRPFQSTTMVPGIEPEELVKEYLPWVRRHYTFIHWPDRSTQPTMSWVLERFRENIIRTGAKLAILDPWQEFDDEMPDFERNHSRWIGKVIQKFIGLCFELRCNIVIIAHPTKLKRNKDGKIEVPDGNDIADSVHFFSRCDTGFTIHRPNDQSSEMLLRIWKVREWRFARYGDTALAYRSDTHRIYPRPVEVEPHGVPILRHWQDD